MAKVNRNELLHNKIDICLKCIAFLNDTKKDPNKIRNNTFCWERERSQSLIWFALWKKRVCRNSDMFPCTDFPLIQTIVNKLDDSDTINLGVWQELILNREEEKKMWWRDMESGGQCLGFNSNVHQSWICQSR